MKTSMTFAFLLGLALLTVGCGDSADFSGSETKTAETPKAQPQPQPKQTGTVVTTAPAATSSAPAIPAKAVKQGSFTVWTMPADPAPGENYQVFIRVQLPANVAKYDGSDLSGSVEGTDHYEQLFGAGQDDGYGVTRNGSTATMAIDVPGGQDHVRDTVKVRSKLLNESQTISIVF